MIDLDWIQRLIRMVDESDVDSLEISRFATRIRISKSPPVHLLGGAGPGGAMAASPAARASADASLGGEAREPGPGPSGAPDAAAESGVIEVESPMVGTFYRAAAPDAPPYVEVGDRIQKGQTLCILEAMKLMNELEAEVAGTLREICTENGEPVEYGQVLFRIAPD